MLTSTVFVRVPPFGCPRTERHDMRNPTARRLALRTLLIAPWLVLNLSHASEPNFVPKAQLAVDKVYAIVGPLGQRSVANAGLNANYGFLVTDQGVILGLRPPRRRASTQLST